MRLRSCPRERHRVPAAETNGGSTLNSCGPERRGTVLGRGSCSHELSPPTSRVTADHGRPSATTPSTSARPVRRPRRHQPQRRCPGGLRCLTGFGLSSIPARYRCRHKTSARRRIAGKTDYSAGTYTVTGAGVDIWDASDQFRYVYQPVSGDINVVVRVASLTAVNAWTKAGVMIRESLSSGSRHAMALVSAQNGYAFQRRVDTSSFSEHTFGGSGGAPQWVRLVRTGSQFQAFRSADGRTWTLMETDTIPMGTTAYVGLAVTSHNPAVAATAVFDNFTVSAAQPSPNQPPVVSLTQPGNGGQYAPGASIGVAATASDPENRLSRVEFFSGTTRIGSDPTAPYSMTWSSVPAGTYSIFAVAYDADGGSTTSNISTVNVAAAVHTAAPGGIRGIT